MDANFLMQASRLCWDSPLSPLLERRARQAGKDSKKSLACPKCCVPWIPGLNAEARERAGPGSKTKGKNQRARRRASKRRIEKLNKFEEKLRLKKGQKFVPEAELAPSRFLRYNCRECSGNLVLSLRSVERKRSQAPEELVKGPKKGIEQKRKSGPATNHSPIARPPKVKKLSLGDFML